MYAQSITTCKNDLRVSKWHSGNLKTIYLDTKGHIRFHLYGISSIGKSRETESRHDCQGLGRGGEVEVYRVSFWDDENVLAPDRWQLHNTVNALNATDLFTFKMVNFMLPVDFGLNKINTMYLLKKKKRKIMPYTVPQLGGGK